MSARWRWASIVVCSITWSWGHAASITYTAMGTWDAVGSSPGIAGQLYGAQWQFDPGLGIAGNGYVDFDLTTGGFSARVTGDPLLDSLVTWNSMRVWFSVGLGHPIELIQARDSGRPGGGTLSLNFEHMLVGYSDNTISYFSSNPVLVPIPAAVWLLGSALALLPALRFRRNTLHDDLAP
jgi:hypothetical protein